MLWLLADTPMPASAQNNIALEPAPFQNNDFLAATVYPSSSLAPEPIIFPSPVSPTTRFSQSENFPGPASVPGYAPAQLVSFQQEAMLPPPASQPPPGNLFSQMVQQDTAGTDLNSMVNQPNYAPPPTAASPAVTGNYNCDPNAWHSQVLPQGIIYQSYLAGTKEPRFATFFNESSDGAVANKTPVENFTGIMRDMWDVTLGARAGIWRYGNDDPNWPEGWQLDIEGAVFPRLAPDGFSTPLLGDDYRFGIPLTYGGDKWEFKMGYYHISAHVGDEYLLYVNNQANRINYVRDSAILGAGYFLTPAFRMYGEVGYAAVDGGAKPVELQFGCEWVQAHNTGPRGGPFAAINGDLRQEVDYGGNVNVQFGWMWRQYARGSNIRIGGQYFYGKDDEYEFFRNTVSRIGWGMWYDF